MSEPGKISCAIIHRDGRYHPPIVDDVKSRISKQKTESDVYYHDPISFDARYGFDVLYDNSQDTLMIGKKAFLEKEDGSLEEYYEAAKIPNFFESIVKKRLQLENDDVNEVGGSGSAPPRF